MVSLNEQLCRARDKNRSMSPLKSNAASGVVETDHEGSPSLFYECNGVTPPEGVKSSGHFRARPYFVDKHL